MQVEILDWGCRITAIRVPDKNGKLIDTVLKYKQLDDYNEDNQYLGCTIGRYANRIANASFPLNEKTVQLTANESLQNNHLHGGEVGFDKKYWRLVTQTETSLELEITSPHGEEGYPGTLTLTTRYELLDTNQLDITYRATSDQSTIVNITNHSYFNLSDGQQSIDSHEIKVNATYYTPLDEANLPISPSKETVDGTIYDLRHFQSVATVKDGICNTNYLTEPLKELKKIATLVEKNSGRQLIISSDYPALQLYFGNYLSTPFQPCQGLCVEPHYAPNSPNIDMYPSVVLHPGQEYNHVIKYTFENF